MLKLEVLKILESDARTSPEAISRMTGGSLDEIKQMRTQMMSAIGQQRVNYLIIHTRPGASQPPGGYPGTACFDEIVLSEESLKGMVVVMSIYEAE